MNDSFKDSLANRRRWAKEWGMVQTLDTPDYQAFLMSPLKKKTRNPSTQFVFTPEGIVIMGDLCPARQGIISCYGYGLKWFVGKLSAGYLAGKFLATDFQVDVVCELLSNCADNGADFWDEPVTTDPDEIRALAGAIEGNEVGMHAFRDTVAEDWGWSEDCCDLPGWTYNTEDWALLVALQERFSELYWETEAAP